MTERNLKSDRNFFFFLLWSKRYRKKNSRQQNGIMVWKRKFLPYRKRSNERRRNTFNSFTLLSAHRDTSTEKIKKRVDATEHAKVTIGRWLRQPLHKRNFRNICFGPSDSCVGMVNCLLHDTICQIWWWKREEEGCETLSWDLSGIQTGILERCPYLYFIWNAQMK